MGAQSDFELHQSNSQNSLKEPENDKDSSPRLCEDIGSSMNGDKARTGNDSFTEGRNARETARASSSDITLQEQSSSHSSCCSVDTTAPKQQLCHEADDADISLKVKSAGEDFGLALPLSAPSSVSGQRRRANSVGSVESLESLCQMDAKERFSLSRNVDLLSTRAMGGGSPKLRRSSLRSKSVLEGDEEEGGESREGSEALDLCIPTQLVSRRSEQSELGTATTGGTQRRKSSIGWSSIVKFRENSQSIYDGETVDTYAKRNIWTKLTKKTDVWDEIDEEDVKISLKYGIQNCWSSFKTSFESRWKIVRRHKYIAVLSALMFASLTAAGILTVLQFANQYEEARMQEAIILAKEMGSWFSDQLDRAILPLFSMAQFVQQLDIFRDLPSRIGQAGAPGSLPHLPPKIPGGPATHRNVTGVCDRPDLVDRFTDIAATIKKDAGMEGVLVNIQLAPMAVVCLMHPMNNTEDFPQGVYMDNTGAWGHDLLVDPKRKFIAQKTIPSEGVVTAGPLTLRQCDECDPTVEKAFIARLPINMEGAQIEVDGQIYPSWGFAVALINWKALIDRSDVRSRAEDSGMQFRLTRADVLMDQVTHETTEKVVTLAESSRATLLHEGNSETVDLETTDNQWQMTVGYEDGFRPAWETLAIVFSIVASFMVTAMFFTMLVEKKSHDDLLKDIIPAQALRKMKKGEVVVEKYNLVTIFFSDIVGYTSLAADLRPIEVMKMLNEFYGEMDKLADKHKVYKVETIGDAYMVTGGLPDRCIGPLGAERVALFALDAIELVKDFRTADGTQLFIRAGLSSGPVVAGVVGTRRPRYAVFGDTVNAAARMESTSIKMNIQCSDMTYRILRDAPNYSFEMEERGGIKVKGKGIMNTWWIVGAKKGRPAPLDCTLHSSSEEKQTESTREADENNVEPHISSAHLGRAQFGVGHVPFSGSENSRNIAASDIPSVQPGQARCDLEQGSFSRCSTIRMGSGTFDGDSDSQCQEAGVSLSSLVVETAGD